MRILVTFLACLSIFNIANAASHSTTTENEKQWDKFVQTNMNVQLLDPGDSTQSLAGGKWNSIIIAGENIDLQSSPVLRNIPTVPYPVSEVGNIMIYDTGLKDARLLSSVRKARAINIFEPGLETLQGLEKSKEAESVNIANGKLSRAQGLSGLEKVGELSFSGNNLGSLDGLSSLTEIERLNVNFNKLTSSAPLQNIEKIK